MKQVGFAISLGIVLALLPAALLAQSMSATNADGKITLTKDPCLLAGPWFKNWRAAKWMYRGKMYEACWSVAGTRGGGQSILVIDSDGQVSQIDPNAFAPDQGA